MKKFLALALVFVLVFASAITLSAANGNVANETVEALRFTKAPTFDGKITAAEWGEPTIKVTKDHKTAWQVDNGSGDLTMNIYLRWDDANFYVGVTSPDKDGQSLPANEGGTWNGDSVQFRLDPKGPNSAGDKDAPFGEVNNNLGFALFTADNKESSWDFTKALDPTTEGTKFKFGSADGIFTWEIAVPHAYFEGAGKVDTVYGLSLVRLNAPTDAGYNGWLTWGDGVCGPQDNAERCGANGVKLVKTEAIKVVVETPKTDKADGGAAQTSDIELVMFAVLAVIALGGAVLVTKKSR